MTPEEYNAQDVAVVAKIHEAMRKMTMRDWYGNEGYPDAFAVGEQYIGNFESTDEEAKLAGQCCDVIIEITYIRSGVAFYNVEGHPEHEFHFGLRSIFAAFLKPRKFPSLGMKMFEPHDDTKLE